MKQKVLAFLFGFPIWMHQIGYRLFGKVIVRYHDSETRSVLRYSIRNGTEFK
jgi:hypothetical protein